MESTKLRRYGQIIGLKPEAIQEYIQYHADVWPEVLRTIKECNIRNYSIFLKGNTLFAYFEYLGDNFEADMLKMAADPKTQEWWAIMKPMQEPIPNRSPREWWADMVEVFHTD
jgi:L-rhamnose mutarotase